MLNFAQLGYYYSSGEALPTDFEGLQFWHDISQHTGLNDGDTIPTLLDFSGNNRSISQVTAGRRGIYKTNILNGLPILRTDGTFTAYQSTTKTDWDWIHQGDTTLIFIFYPKTDGIVGCLFDNGGTSAANVGRVIEIQATARMRDLCVAASSPNDVFSALPLINTLPKDQWHMTVHRYEEGASGEDFTLQFNDVLVDDDTGTLSPSANTSTNNPTFFGRQNLTNHINCDYAWGCGFNRALTDNELSRLIGSTVSIYGL